MLGPFRHEADCLEWAYYQGQQGVSLEKYLFLRAAASEVEPGSESRKWCATRLENGHFHGKLNETMGRMGLWTIESPSDTTSATPPRWWTLVVSQAEFDREFNREFPGGAN
jgi:hypothetical protein